jgi:transcriptional regulator with XRE-family HTH domain
MKSRRDNVIPAAFDRFVGHRLRQERQLASKSPGNLARELGTGEKVLEQYERGERRIPDEVLFRAAQALGVSTSAFFSDIARSARSVAYETTAPASLAIPRSLKYLVRPEFAQTHRPLALWSAARGLMTQDVMSAIRRMPRTMLVRRPSGSERLVWEHFAPTFGIVLPCESLSLVGQEMRDYHDSAYGAWMAAAYDRSMWDRRLRLEAALADIRTTKNMGKIIVRARYDRVLIPWRAQGDDFVLCLSLLRNRTELPGM